MFFATSSLPRIASFIRALSSSTMDMGGGLAPPRQVRVTPRSYDGASGVRPGPVLALERRTLRERTVRPPLEDARVEGDLTANAVVVHIEDGEAEKTLALLGTRELCDQRCFVE